MRAPELPVTWRPRRTRLVAYGFAVVIMAGAVVLALLMGEPWTWGDRIALIVFAALVCGLLHLLARVRIVADRQGLTLVNAVRTHRRSWAEVVDVGMAEGDPWPKIDFSDGTTVGAMGIQGSEKAAAHRALAELEALIHQHAEAPGGPDDIPPHDTKEDPA
ncbi:PH domain-containing protein [Nonomuraea sp. NPDC050310]|uniref:PH domain-containing protein n=1 Tax=Nonomuraea sp. NPDC050310 TaxID=3154935 RepID=UPI003410B959